jgi:hypothetical protein
MTSVRNEVIFHGIMWRCCFEQDESFEPESKELLWLGLRPWLDLFKWGEMALRLLPP